MKEWSLYLYSGLFVESVARMLPKFLWPTLPLKAVNKNLFVFGGAFFVCLLLGFFLSLRLFKYVSSRPLLVELWEIYVPAGFGMSCELNNSMMLLPEGLARFHVARSTHASRVCRLCVPVVPRAKACKSTHGNLAAKHSVQVHSSVFFLGPGMQLHTLVWHSWCIYLWASALCYPYMPGITAGTCILLCWHFTRNTGTYSCLQVLLDGLVLEELDSLAWRCVPVILL